MQTIEMRVGFFTMWDRTNIDYPTGKLAAQLPFRYEPRPACEPEDDGTPAKPILTGLPAWLSEATEQLVMNET